MTFGELPLYASDAELAQAVLGKRAPAWRQLVQLYEGRGLPPIDALTGGRYTPAVRQFLDALHGVGGSRPPVMPATDGMEQDTWHTRKKRRPDKGPSRVP